ASTVSDGLSSLATAGRQVAAGISTVAGWVKTLYSAYKMYTTEFRLLADALSVVAIVFGGPLMAAIGVASLLIRHFDQIKAAWEKLKGAFQGGDRSEEHTSELQSRENLVCRLLLEKKKNNKQMEC